MTAARARRALSGPKVQLVQVAKRRLALADEDYRNILYRARGVRSCTELSDDGFRQLMEIFAHLGFQSTSAAANFGRRDGFATTGQVAVIRRLWQEYTAGQSSGAKLDRWLDGTFGVSALRFLPADKGPKAIAALRAMIGRRQAEARVQRGA